MGAGLFLVPRLILSMGLNFIQRRFIKQMLIEQGDCLEILPTLNCKVDLVLADPPYGKTTNLWDKVINFEILWQSLNKYPVVLIFGVEPFSSRLRISNEKNYRYDWTWIKNRPTGAVLCNKQPLSSIENISVFFESQPIYNPIMAMRTTKELKRISKDSQCKNSDFNGVGFSNLYTQKREQLTLKYPTRDLYFKTVFNRSKEKVAHPSQKPVELLEYLIKTYTNTGDTVLDFCMGSGSTGVAANNLGRNFIGFEKNKEYFELARSRLTDVF